MTPRGLEQLLAAAARAAAIQAPLPDILRQEGGPDGPAIARRLDAGEDLPTALAHHLTPAERELLAGPRPGLEAVALLLLETRRQARERRWAWADLLLRPSLSLVVVGIATGFMAQEWELALTRGWLMAAGGTLLVVTVLLVLAPRWAAHLPWLSAWDRHRQQAERLERAALVARWNLDEARLVPWLGRDLGQLGGVLGRPGAEAHCRRLAAWHRAAATTAHHRLGLAMAFLITLAAAFLLLAVATPGAATLLAGLEALEPG